MGNREAIPAVIVVADTGPLLHLHWVGASPWALPPLPLHVVEAVWREVERHAKQVLQDSRLLRVATEEPLSPLVVGLGLDQGEQAALSYALSKRSREDVLVLCDERSARAACVQLSLLVTGSVGLILEAARAHRVPLAIAISALEGLPGRGHLHVSPSLIQQAVAALSTPSEP